MEQQNCLLQAELLAAESTLRKEKAAKRDVPLLAETAPPPGLCAAYEQALERQAKPPPSLFDVPAGMKNYLDRLSSSHSITGLASPPRPRSMASVGVRASGSPFQLKQLLLHA